MPGAAPATVATGATTGDRALPGTAERRANDFAAADADPFKPGELQAGLRHQLRDQGGEAFLVAAGHRLDPGRQHPSTVEDSGRAGPQAGVYGEKDQRVCSTRVTSGT